MNPSVALDDGTVGQDRPLVDQDLGDRPPIVASRYRIRNRVRPRNVSRTGPKMYSAYMLKRRWMGKRTPASAGTPEVSSRHGSEPDRRRIHQPGIGDRSAGHVLQHEEHDAQSDEHVRHDGRAARAQGADDRGSPPRHPGPALSHALRALHADGRRCLAFGADVPAAALAADPGLALRMPVADRGRLGLGVRVRHEIGETTVALRIASAISTARPAASSR